MGLLTDAQIRRLNKNTCPTVGDARLGDRLSKLGTDGGLAADAIPDEAITAAKIAAGAPHACIVVAANDASAKVKATADYVCDGTNDEVPINAAAVVANANGGGVVLLSIGTFNIDDALSVPSNVTLRGSGWGTDSVFADHTDLNSSHMVITNSDRTGGNSNITIENLYVDGNKGTTGVPTQNGWDTTTYPGTDAMGNRGCLDFRMVDHLIVRDCRVDEAWAAGIELQWCHESRIEDNRIYKSADDAIGVNIGCRNIVVTRNTISHVAVDRVYGGPNGIEVQDGAYNVSVFGNILMSLTDANVDAGVGVNSHANDYAITGVDTVNETFTVAQDISSLVAGQTLTVAGSSGNNGDWTVVSVDETGHVVTVAEDVADPTPDGTIAFRFLCHGISIASNVFTDVKYGVQVAAGQYDIAIAGNTIMLDVDDGNAGIQLAGCNHITIIGNVLEGKGAHLIRGDGAVAITDVTVSGNTFYNSAGTGNTTGIQLNSTITRWLVLGNVFSTDYAGASLIAAATLTDVRFAQNAFNIATTGIFIRATGSTYADCVIQDCTFPGVANPIRPYDGGKVPLPTGWTVRNCPDYPSPGDVQTIVQRMDHADIVDGGGAVGTYEFNDDLPADVKVLSISRDITEAFKDTVGSNTEVKVTLGDGTDVDRWDKTAATGDDIWNSTTDAAWDHADFQGTVVTAAAKTPTIAFTTDSDVTDLISGAGAQGTMTLYITYRKL